MKIANVMFSRGGGGIEQAFLDYQDALAASGFEAIAVISKGAAIETKLRERGTRYHVLAQHGWWDVVAAFRLARIFRIEGVAAVLAHGGRALSLARTFRAAPLIAVAHNYNKMRLTHTAAAIATTEDIRQHLGRAAPGARIFVVPNAVRVGDASEPVPFRNPPVIGAMGRMVEKKGFDIFCNALASLKAQGITSKAIIAGDGPTRPALEDAIRALNLQSEITLPGWIEGAREKAAFWRDIDIFCLPSLHEPFGIVLLEAWSHGKPVVSTATEGPRALADDTNAILVPPGDTEALASGLAALLGEPDHARHLAASGHRLVRERYTIDRLAERLGTVIHSVVAKRHTPR